MAKRPSRSYSWPHYRIKVSEMWARLQWCNQQFGPEQVDETWWRDRGFIFFKEKRDFTWFILRWGGQNDIDEKRYPAR